MMFNSAKGWSQVKFHPMAIRFPYEVVVQPYKGSMKSKWFQARGAAVRYAERIIEVK